MPILLNKNTPEDDWMGSVNTFEWLIEREWTRRKYMADGMVSNASKECCI